jgi:hypothetical protein
LKDNSRVCPCKYRGLIARGPYKTSKFQRLSAIVTVSTAWRYSHSHYRAHTLKSHDFMPQYSYLGRERDGRPGGLKLPEGKPQIIDILFWAGVFRGFVVRVSGLAGFVFQGMFGIALALSRIALGTILFSFCQVLPMLLR